MSNFLVLLDASTGLNSRRKARSGKAQRWKLAVVMSYMLGAFLQRKCTPLDGHAGNSIPGVMDRRTQLHDFKRRRPYVWKTERCAYAGIRRFWVQPAHVSPDQTAVGRQPFWDQKPGRTIRNNTAKRWTRLRKVAGLGAAVQMSAVADAKTLASAKFGFLN